MLRQCELFFSHLNSTRIAYCHWKSNSHLDKALNGQTDLDILADQKSKPQFESALKKFDFKKVVSSSSNAIPGLEDYLGFDRDTGKLIHLHVHYKLILGKRYIKNHHLPIEEFIFDNLEEKEGVKIPCPELELTLLIVRANFKLGAWKTFKFAVKRIMGRNESPYPRDIDSEFKELINSSDPKTFSKIIRNMGLPLREELLVRFLQRLKDGDLGLFDVLKCQFEINRKLKPFSRENGIKVVIRYNIQLLKNLRPIRRFAKKKKKTLPGQGLYISFVGADGSGKSTITQDIRNWLAWKLDVENIYLGIPKTFPVKTWSFLIRNFRKIHMGIVSDFLKGLFWIYIARDRKRGTNESRKSADRGKIVITDRFPLSDFWKMKEPMDGPRLRDFQGTIFEPMAIKEEAIYNSIKMPDHVFALRVDLNELEQRKKTLNPESQKLKTQAVNAIRSSQNTTFIDANRAYPEVLLDIKSRIWNLV